jgi:hypothetical protein
MPAFCGCAARSQNNVPQTLVKLRHSESDALLRSPAETAAGTAAGGIVQRAHAGPMSVAERTGRRRTALPGNNDSPPSLSSPSPRVARAKQLERLRRRRAEAECHSLKADERATDEAISKVVEQIEEVAASTS